MVELLIVIAVLGILAVAVLSAINPIEQINRSYDTGSRSDAEQLISAVDRYYTTKSYYPWQSGANDTTNNSINFVNTKTLWNTTTVEPVLNNLSGSTGELKDAYISKIVGDTYRTLYIYNGGAQGNSTYVCFDPRSSAFKDSAKKRCEGTEGSIPSDLLPVNGTVCNTSVNTYFSCLP